MTKSADGREDDDEVHEVAPGHHERPRDPVHARVRTERLEEADHHRRGEAGRPEAETVPEGVNRFELLNGLVEARGVAGQAAAFGFESLAEALPARGNGARSSPEVGLVEHQPGLLIWNVSDSKRRSSPFRLPI